MLAVSIVKPCDPEVGTITCLGRCIPWLASTVMGTTQSIPASKNDFHKLIVAPAISKNT
jgi:hypothetical protein